MELLIPIFIFGLWTVFSVSYIWLFWKAQTTKGSDKKIFWNNPYLFETIPSVFPTIGIFCTALGITMGLWNFDNKNIEGGIQNLLQGLKLAFFATMAGILGLIIFQKINVIIQKKIDDHPNREPTDTDELSAISRLTNTIENLKNESQEQNEKLIKSFGNDLENKVGAKLSILEKEILNLQKQSSENQKATNEGLNEINITTNNGRFEITEQLKNLREENKISVIKSNDDTDKIIKAMTVNNELVRDKFDEFVELLKKNNTEALVEVMKNATEQFNAQMNELINKLVQENFKELNNSVKSLNDWQKENKEQIQILTGHFQKTTEMFNISAITLKEVASNTKLLTDNDSKLNQIVQELKRVMIEDGKFQEITKQIQNTVTSLETTSDSFDETTNKLTVWVQNQMDFSAAAEVLIKKIEEFKDFNSDVWKAYRNEMTEAVKIIKSASSSLKGDLQDINGEFYERLNDTLANLDKCIQGFMTTKK